MLKSNKFKPVIIIPARLNRQIDIYFAHKVFEKYGINRFRKQAGCLVFRRGISQFKEPRVLKTDSMPQVMHNHSWYLNEYKPIINYLMGRKVPVYLKAVKDKPAPLYIYSERLLNQPVFPGTNTPIERTPDRMVHISNTGLVPGVRTKKDKSEEPDSRTVNTYQDRTVTNENTLTDYKIFPGSRILQYVTTTLQRNLYQYTGIKNFNSGTKPYYVKLPAEQKYFQYEKPAPLIPAEPPEKAYNTEHKNTEHKNTVETLLYKQLETPYQNAAHCDQVFNYIRPNNITEFSNHYRTNKNILLQAEDTCRKVAGKSYEGLKHTNIGMDMVLKRLYYQAAPRIRPWERQNREVTHRQAYMPTQKNTPESLPEGKSSGLILYRPKREKATAAENQSTEDMLPERNEVYTKALATSSRGNKTDIDSPEGINLIAEKVYGLLEKRLGIQKDRRGIR